MGPEGDGEERDSEGDPRDLDGDGLGTQGDGEEPDSKGDPRDLDGDGLGMREGLAIGEITEENTQLSVAGMQSETQEAIKEDLTTSMGAEVNQGSFVHVKAIS